MGASAVVTSPTRTGAGFFAHPGPLCACGVLGSLPALTCQASFPDREAEGSLPLFELSQSVTSHFSTQAVQ